MIFSGTHKARVLKDLLKAVTTFVPRKKYERKLKNILSMDEKNRNVDLKGWKYRKIKSGDESEFHRYYYYPSSCPNAEVLLLLHGLNYDGRYFQGLREISDKYELIAYDYPEKWDVLSDSIDCFIDKLDDFIQVMNLKSFHVLGVSLGGMMSLRFVGKRKDFSVKSLILLSAQIPGYAEKEREQNRILNGLVRSLPDYKLYWIQEKLNHLYLRRMNRSDARWIKFFLRPKDMSFYRQVSESFRDYCGKEDGENISCPVLFLIGTQDKLIPQESIENLMETISHARIECVMGGTHDMLLRQTRLCFEQIKAFLRKNTYN